MRRIRLSRYTSTWHHPDLDLAYGRLDVRLISLDVAGVTSREVVLALTIIELALAAGAAPNPERTSVLGLGLNSADEAEIRPFWAALLDYDGSWYLRWGFGETPARRMR